MDFPSASGGRKKEELTDRGKNLWWRKGESFFFFIFHTRFIGRSDWSKGNIGQGGSAWNSAAEIDIIHLSVKVGKVSKAKKETGNGRMRRPQSCTQGNVGLIPKTFEFPRFCSRYIYWIPSPMIFSLEKQDGHEKIRKEKNWIYINEMLEIEQVREGQVSL